VHSMQALMHCPSGLFGGRVIFKYAVLRIIDPNPPLPRVSPLAHSGNEPERTKMRGRLAREWRPIPPRRGMQSIGGRTSSQQHQFQEPSQPQHSRTNKFSFQGPSC
jgi:hypothetical protein